MTAPLIIDLDGVLRIWNPQHTADIERRYGLPIGSILTNAFSPERLRAAVTGTLTDTQWRTEVAAALEHDYGAAATLSVAEWTALSGEVNVAVLEIVREQRLLRAVVLASNATDRLSRDLAALGLEKEFDAVFNSAEMGVAKPDLRVFDHIADALGVRAGDCLFVDDSVASVEAAARGGLVAHRYRSPEELKTFLATP